MPLPAVTVDVNRCHVCHLWRYETTIFQIPSNRIENSAKSFPVCSIQFDGFGNVAELERTNTNEGMSEHGKAQFG
ncbi:MAG: hypothetical protein EBW87_03485 [Burkholderiaceae bacterium]|nr:hypothetical protein [Burkholderiaceae bacterium]